MITKRVWLGAALCLLAGFLCPVGSALAQMDPAADPGTSAAGRTHPPPLVPSGKHTREATSEYRFGSPESRRIPVPEEDRAG